MSAKKNHLETIQLKLDWNSKFFYNSFPKMMEFVGAFLFEIFVVSFQFICNDTQANCVTQMAKPRVKC